jgi:NAD-dependent deacetylase
VVEYHGNILRDRCSVEGVVSTRAGRSLSGLPECARCGELLRPDVVWFGEPIPRQAMLLADAAAAECDVFMSLGTSAVVYPAAGLAARARQSGASVIEINLEPTDLSALADVSLHGPAGRLLPALLEALGE